MEGNFSSRLCQPGELMVNNNYIPGSATYRQTLPMQSAISADMPTLTSHARRPIAFGSSDYIPPMYMTNNGQGAESLDIDGSVVNEMLPVDSASYNVLPSQQNGLPTTQTRSQDLPIPSCSCSFTFTTPTQSYVYSPTLTSTTPNRLNYTRVTPQTFAPTGCSAQWQHSIPPRSRHRLPLTQISSQQAANVFTGLIGDSVCSLPASFPRLIEEPVPSCSTVQKRPKRPHGPEPEDLCPNKIHLTQEKIEEHMKELRIHNRSPPTLLPTTDLHTRLDVASQENLINSGVNGDTTVRARSFFPLTTQEQWANYQQLENRLEMIEEDSPTDRDDDDDGVDVAVDVADNRRLHILQSIEPSSQQLLPPEILSNIVNPCRQLIVWNPPDPSVKLAVTSPDKMEDAQEADTNNSGSAVSFDAMDGVEVEGMEDTLDL